MMNDLIIRKELIDVIEDLFSLIESLVFFEPTIGSVIFLASLAFCIGTCGMVFFDPKKWEEEKKRKKHKKIEVETAESKIQQLQKAGLL